MIENNWRSSRHRARGSKILTTYGPPGCLIRYWVPEYICYIARKYCNYLKCVKMIVYRYRYVVKQLHEKGLKINLPFETGCIKLKEIKLAELDLVRIAQHSYFGKNNMLLIQKSGFMNALKCCSKNCCLKLIEIKNVLLSYDYNECVLCVGGRRHHQIVVAS